MSLNPGLLSLKGMAHIHPVSRSLWMHKDAKLLLVSVCMLSYVQTTSLDVWSVYVQVAPHRSVALPPGHVEHTELYKAVLATCARAPNALTDTQWTRALGEQHTHTRHTHRSTHTHKACTNTNMHKVMEKDAG